MKDADGLLHRLTFRRVPTGHIIYPGVTTLGKLPDK